MLSAVESGSSPCGLGFRQLVRATRDAATVTVDTPKSILVLAPHPDDAELGCGGTMARFIEEGARVVVATFSLCEDSLPAGWPKGVREVEARKAITELPLDQERLLIYRYPVRRLASYRQEILDDLVGLQSEISPDLVFMPSTDDLHQDHTTVACEGLRAFKQTTVFAYEMPWNNIAFRTTAFVALEERHIERKVCAISHYESQRNGAYMAESFTRGLARTRGVAIGAEFAEAFDVVRTIYR
jgi:N-acetylglucosamine malate deacetylase 1